MSVLDAIHAEDHSTIPATSDEMIAKYLSYAQTAKTDQEKESRHQNARQRPNIAKYEQALRTLAEREGGMQKIVELAEAMKKNVRDDARRLDITLSPLSKDRTSYIWDIAKQSYFLNHDQETTDEYRQTLADPIGDDDKSKAKRREIENRQLGREAYRSYRQGKEWKQYVDSHEEEFGVLGQTLLEQDPKADGQLTSLQYAMLGEAMRSVAARVETEREAEEAERRAAQAAAAQSNTPPEDDHADPAGNNAPHDAADAHANPDEDAHAGAEESHDADEADRGHADDHGHDKDKKQKKKKELPKPNLETAPIKDITAYYRQEAQKQNIPAKKFDMSWSPLQRAIWLPIGAVWNASMPIFTAIKEFGQDLWKGVKDSLGLLKKAFFDFKAMNASTKPFKGGGGGGGGHEKKAEKKKDDHGGGHH